MQEIAIHQSLSLAKKLLEVDTIPIPGHLRRVNLEDKLQILLFFGNFMEISFKRVIHDIHKGYMITLDVQSLQLVPIHPGYQTSRVRHQLKQPSVDIQNLCICPSIPSVEQTKMIQRNL